MSSDPQFSRLKLDLKLKWSLYSLFDGVIVEYYKENIGIVSKNIEKVSRYENTSF